MTSAGPEYMAAVSNIELMTTPGTDTGQRLHLLKD